MGEGVGRRGWIIESYQGLIRKQAAPLVRVVIRRADLNLSFYFDSHRPP